MRGRVSPEERSSEGGRHLAECTRGRPKTVTNYSRPRKCELGAPLTRQHRMLAPPHRDCVTMWALDGAAFFVRRNLHVVVARARVPEFAKRGQLAVTLHGGMWTAGGLCVELTLLGASLLPGASACAHLRWNWTPLVHRHAPCALRFLHHHAQRTRGMFAPVVRRGV